MLRRRLWRNTPCKPAKSILAQIAPPCGSDDPGTITVLRACSYSEGSTACDTTEDFSACTSAAGTIQVATDLSGDGTGTILLNNVGFVNGNLEASPPSTEVEYNGRITIEVAPGGVTFSEAQTIVATQPDGQLTHVDAKSRFTIAVAASELTFNGEVDYLVQRGNTSLGLVNAVFRDFVLALTTSVCDPLGPVSGTIDIAIASFSETARARVTGCNQMVLENLENGAVARSTTLSATDVASIFASTLPLLATMTAAPSSLAPVSDAPFAAAAEVTALAEPETWCRLFTSSDDKPVIAKTAEVEAAAGVPVAECLLFGSAATTLADPPSTERSLIAALFALSGTGGTEADISLLSAVAGLPLWDPNEALLTSVLTYRAAIGTGPGEVDTLATLRERAAAALLYAGTSTGAQANPFSEGVNEPAPGVIIPDMRCIGEDHPFANAATAPSEQCVPEEIRVRVDFSPVGMWLLDADRGEGLGLYLKIIPGG